MKLHKSLVYNSADTTARSNGSVGGEITKRLVAMAEQQLGGRANR